MTRQKLQGKSKSLPRSGVKKSVQRGTTAKTKVSPKSDGRSRKALTSIKPAGKTAPSKPSRSTQRTKSSAVVHKKQRAANRTTTKVDEVSIGAGVGSSKFLIDEPARTVAPHEITPDLPQVYERDRVVVMVRDPFWLHVYWELTRGTIERAEAALGQDWHHAKPILRLLDVTSEDTTSATESVVRDIEIHGGTNNWYIDVQQPPRSFRVDVGYRTKAGRFYVLTRSNVVNTPKPGMSDKIDEHWTDINKKYEKIYAMSAGSFGTQNCSSAELRKLLEERLRRPMSSPSVTSYGSGNMPAGGKGRKFWFQLDAELIVYGATEPTAKVTLQGEPVQLRSDGTFTMRFSLPDCRQIIPAVAKSIDGVEERTIVLAVERNTKELEPMIHENGEM
jgi:hypothetical protein